MRKPRENPRDIFYSDYILRYLPDARFVVCLRDPVHYAWSAINFPGVYFRDAAGRFGLSDVEKVAHHWTKVAHRVLSDGLLDDQRYLVIEQERLTARPETVFADIGKLVEIDDLATHAAAFGDSVNHSSFGGIDRIITDSGEMEAARKGRDAVLDEPDFVDIVLQVCNPWLCQMQDKGLLSDGLTASQPALNGVAGEEAKELVIR